MALGSTHRQAELDVIWCTCRQLHVERALLTGGVVFWLGTGIVCGSVMQTILAPRAILALRAATRAVRGDRARAILFF